MTYIAEKRFYSKQLETFYLCLRAWNHKNMVSQWFWFFHSSDSETFLETFGIWNVCRRIRTPLNEPLVPRLFDSTLQSYKIKGSKRLICLEIKTLLERMTAIEELSYTVQKLSSMSQTVIYSREYKDIYEFKLLRTSSHAESTEGKSTTLKRERLK